MAIQEEQDYNIFLALVETIHNKDRKKLRFAKCKKCGRLTPFRLASTNRAAIKCKKCESKIIIKTSIHS